jgi:hypothetical protein
MISAAMPASEVVVSSRDFGTNSAQLYAAEAQSITTCR